MIGPLLDNLFEMMDTDGPAPAAVAEPPGRVNPRLLDHLRETLADLDRIYSEAAEECIALGTPLDGLQPDAFRERMADLRRGLVVRIFLEMAGVDWTWHPGEVAVAQVIFEHLWQRPLPEERVPTLLDELGRQAKPDWHGVVNPFVRLPPFQRHRDELLSDGLRLANLIAKADGKVTPEEKQQLNMLRSHLENLLKPLKLADEPKPLAAGNQALQTREAAPAKSGTASPPSTAAAGSTKSPEQRFQEAQAELERLVGLASIKQEVQSLMNFLKLQRERAAHGLPESKISLHSVFQGNPGTGKTTVARLIGQLLGALGILAKGHLVETDRSGLVAEYAGQTGPKTNKKIDEALDGVLFIDEAYSLVAEKGDDPYGAEAVQTLLKRMEDDRGRLVVILAGYPGPMQRLLRSNPGLSSRFNRFFTFPDYSGLELCQITETLARQCHYELRPLARAKLLLGFAHLTAQRDEHFGNGRLARNLFEKAISRLADRVASIAPLTKELLTHLEDADLPFDELPMEVGNGLEQAQFAVTCPGCQQASRARANQLGRRLQCRRCQQAFTASWGEPLPGRPAG